MDYFSSFAGKTKEHQEEKSGVRSLLLAFLEFNIQHFYDLPLKN